MVYILPHIALSAVLLSACLAAKVKQESPALMSMETDLHSRSALEEQAKAAADNAIAEAEAELAKELPAEEPEAADKKETKVVKKRTAEEEDADFVKGKDEKKGAAKREDKQAILKSGSPKCPCVGLEGVKGQVNVSVGKGDQKKMVPYPAEAFASCSAWDYDSHPACQTDKDGNSWCEEPWCLVDPCNCEIDVAAKKVTGGYWPDADLQGMGGYWYSYATCGGTDVWADEDDQKKMAAKPKECDKKVDEAKWGDSSCQCIGVAGRQGTIDMQIAENVTARYPVDAGATCKAWDMQYHPDCQGKDPAVWCKQIWCFVDPCSCAIPVSPKVTGYLTDATWSGRPVYYSYHTCGGNDTYSESQENACVNQESEEECGNQSRCAWDGEQCLGKELVKACNNAATRVANSSEAAEQEEERTAEKETQERSGALPQAAPCLATCLVLVGSFA